MSLRAALVLMLALAAPALAAERPVPQGSDLNMAIAGASPGDVLRLGRGIHAGPVVIDKPLGLIGDAGAVIDLLSGYKGALGGVVPEGLDVFRGLGHGWRKWEVPSGK